MTAGRPEPNLHAPRRPQVRTHQQIEAVELSEARRRAQNLSEVLSYSDRWDSMWAPLAKHMGVREVDMDFVIPLDVVLI